MTTMHIPDKEEQVLINPEKPKIEIPERVQNPNFGGNEPSKTDPTRVDPGRENENPGHNPWKNDPTRITPDNDPTKTDPTRVK